MPVEELDIEEIKEDTKEEHKIEENIISSTGEVPEEIEEKIEDSYDQSGDKKSNSNNVQTISLSQGNDASVDSHSLEKHNHTEPVNKDKDKK